MAYQYATIMSEFLVCFSISREPETTGDVLLSHQLGVICLVTLTVIGFCWFTWNKKQA